MYDIAVLISGAAFFVVLINDEPILFTLSIYTKSSETTIKPRDYWFLESND